MRKLFLILAILFTLLTVVFSFLPLDTLAFVPLLPAFLFGVLAYIKSDISHKKMPRLLLIITIICALFVIAKTFFVEDEVAKDKNFEQEKIDTKKEAQKELENLENDLE